MKYFVYILQSVDGRFYTGYTTDLERRLKEHQSGSGGKFTRSFGAKEILYKREAQIKAWSREKKEALTLLVFTSCRHLTPIP